MVHMSAKKQNNRLEAVRNAATGYTVIVLSVVCFLLVLAIVIAGVRVIAGSNSASPPNANAQTTAHVGTGTSGSA